MYLKITDLGTMEYKETWDYQQSLNNEMSKAAGEILREQHLLFVEHPHVYTLGKSGKENNLLINDSFLKSIGATFFRTDRGGDITYHGPGQIVGYPIIDLFTMKTGVKKYISNIEQVIIDTVAEYGITGEIMEGATGVWVKNLKGVVPGKICAIGVKVSRGVTMHGFALNVNTDLRYFSYINPCGFTDKTVTSMQQIIGHNIDINEVKNKITDHFIRVFGFNKDDIH